MLGLAFSSAAKLAAALMLASTSFSSSFMIAVHDHGGVAGVVVTNLNRLAKYTLLLDFWC
jgi:hypothetical protein